MTNFLLRHWVAISTAIAAALIAGIWRWTDHPWDVLNSIGRLVLTGIVVIKITRFGETLNKVERIGLGFMGGGSLLTIDVIWKMQASPYLDWSTTVVTYGAVLFLAGRTWRDRKHEINAWRAKRQAVRHHRAMGREV